MGTAAGASSQQKYNELTRSWRRRNRKLFIGVGLACGLVLAMSLLAATYWPRLSYTWGLAGGAAFAFFVIARLSPPGWIENWQTGALGERATAKVLRQLEDQGWVVLHDLPAGRGNVDHIVVGPAGVFLLDSKRLGGTVTVTSGCATVQRPGEPHLAYRHPGSGHLLGLARETHARVLTSSRIRTWVTPVMVVWAEFPQRAVEGRCTYVHGEELVPWLLRQPSRVAPARVNQLADVVRAAWSTERSDS